MRPVYLVRAVGMDTEAKSGGVRIGRILLLIGNPVYLIPYFFRIFRMGTRTDSAQR